jgi:hypothetical protein
LGRSDLACGGWRVPERGWGSIRWRLGLLAALSAAVLLKGQARLSAAQGLDLGLLINAEHNGVGGRIDVEPDDVAHLGGELRIIGELEGTDSVRGGRGPARCAEPTSD